MKNNSIMGFSIVFVCLNIVWRVQSSYLCGAFRRLKYSFFVSSKVKIPKIWSLIFAYYEREIISGSNYDIVKSNDMVTIGYRTQRKKYSYGKIE
uniref:Putative ovule protein n=1 Tax=Solanum chacoense TaxID=4108 RepID=A0A0V0HWF1_SOLCH